MIAIALGCVAVLAWTYLLVARGGFWLARPRDDRAPQAIDAPHAPQVVALVPARNEAASIAATVTSLVQQSYAGAFRIVVIDDESTDATAANARAAAAQLDAEDRVTVLHALPRAQGWTGKLWALQCGVEHVAARYPECKYVLFTDADIVHARDSLAALVARAEAGDLALVSIMAKLRCETFVERAFVPAFIFFFAMLYPFAWVNRRDRPTAGAAGGCMLVRPMALEESGGLAMIRGALIDDCALARRIKMRHAIWLGLSERVTSARAYPGIAEMRRMIVRSAYAQLRFSPLLLALTVLAMMVTYVAPPALTVLGHGPTRTLGVLAWALMAVAMQPVLRFYRVSPWWGPALPVIAAVYVLFTIDSAWQAGRGRAGEWKGRVYPAQGGHALPPE